MYEQTVYTDEEQMINDYKDRLDKARSIVSSWQNEPSVSRLLDAVDKCYLNVGDVLTLWKTEKQARQRAQRNHKTNTSKDVR